jgi:hypothetical protein
MVQYQSTSAHVSAVSYGDMICERSTYLENIVDFDFGRKAHRGIWIPTVLQHRYLCRPRVAAIFGVGGASQNKPESF